MNISIISLTWMLETRRHCELEETHRIARLAFGRFLGMPNPLAFMGDRNLIMPRFRSKIARSNSLDTVEVLRPHPWTCARPSR